ncbi:MAG: RNHCP domain-containing protein [bacterium]|nr:RNHCP domain-containing protein [bacterium]
MKRNFSDQSFEKIKSPRRSFAHEFEGEEEGNVPGFADRQDSKSRRKKTRDYRKTDPGKTESFRCRKCRAMIGSPPAGGSQRNHCPLCLFSMHVDYRPGDRSANCGSSMEPISIWVRKGEWVLLHRCMGCGVIHSNRIAADDSEIVLMSIAAQPLARPAFPLYGEQGSDP